MLEFVPRSVSLHGSWRRELVVLCASALHPLHGRPRQWCGNHEQRHDAPAALPSSPLRTKGARELRCGEQKDGPSPRAPLQRASCPARQSFAVEAPSTSARHRLQEPRLSGSGRGASQAHVLPARARLAGLCFSSPSASAPAPPNSSSRAKTRSTMTSFIKGSTPAASQIRKTPSRSMPRSSALLASRAMAEMSASTSPFAFAASSSTSTRSCLPVPSLKPLLAQSSFRSAPVFSSSSSFFLPKTSAILASQTRASSRSFASCASKASTMASVLPRTSKPLPVRRRFNSSKPKDLSFAFLAAIASSCTPTAKRASTSSFFFAGRLLPLRGQCLFQLLKGHSPQLLPFARGHFLLLLLLLSLLLAVDLVCEERLDHVARLPRLGCRLRVLLVRVPVWARLCEAPRRLLVPDDAIDHDLLHEGVHAPFGAELPQSLFVHGEELFFSGIARLLLKGLVDSVVLLPLLHEQLNAGLFRQDALRSRRGAEVTQLGQRKGLQLLLLLDDNLADARLVCALAFA